MMIGVSEWDERELLSLKGICISPIEWVGLNLNPARLVLCWKAARSARSILTTIGQTQTSAVHWNLPKVWWTGPTRRRSASENKL